MELNLFQPENFATTGQAGSRIDEHLAGIQDLVSLHRIKSRTSLVCQLMSVSIHSVRNNKIGLSLAARQT